MGEIIIVNEEEKSFKFYDIHVKNDNNYCIVSINVKYFYYNIDIDAEPVRYFYDISYTYKYYKNHKLINVTSNNSCCQNNKINIPSTNPFYYYIKNIQDNSIDGVIALANRVTTAIVKQLMMEDKELERELCNRWIVQYRAHLMYTLSTFWD